MNVAKAEKTMNIAYAEIKALGKVLRACTMGNQHGNSYHHIINLRIKINKEGGLTVKKIIISEETKKDMIQKYLSGITISQLSTKFNMSRGKIREILKEEDIYSTSGNYGVKYNWTDSDVEDIKNKYLNEKLSSDEISKIYGCYDTTILNLLKNNGVDTSRKRENHNFTKYHVDENYFESIDTEHKSYWLGFLLADGHVTNNGHVMLTLKSDDVDHIKKFADSIESNHPINKNYRYESYDVVIGSKIMANSLISKGFNNHKSWEYNVEEIVSNIPDNLIHHFIRGYFDGDGSVGIYNQTHSNGLIYNASIVGIIGIVKYIRDKSGVNGSIRYDSRTVNSYTLFIRNKLEVKKFKDFIYKDASVYMNRKHDIFTNME